MTIRRAGTALTVLVCLAGAAPAARQAGTVQPVDYGSASSWLCRPGRDDACRTDLTTTVVAADGGMTREAWTANPEAPIDCFYVYPTVSTDPTPTSDMVADPAEVNVIHQQFARFGSVCRPYAPLYRQVTLAGLRRLIAEGGGGAGLSRGPQYDDVRNAWRHYLEHDNQGRGVVLVGHSQGSFILAELIRQEIDGQPVQSRIVSAILLGATISVPRGRDVGGAFQHMPLCRAATQTGCVITYVSFRSTAPPPSNTRFGKVSEPGMVAACTNPAALAGGSGELRAYLSREGRTITGAARPRPWVTPERPIETPWISVPGLLTASCASNEHATYLEVTVHGNPSDPRSDDITGDLGAGSQILADWGLHLIDVNLAMGNLVDIVSQQSRAWQTKTR
jgi:pimeloyl-ACP methyl ester carboxylesterase